MASSKIKWYFFYTPNYQFYKKNIMNRLTAETDFDARPLEIQPLKLSNSNEKGHHFANLTTKLELMIQCIKEVQLENKEKGIEEDEYIMFTDATIYLSDKVKDMYQYLKERSKEKRDLISAYCSDSYNIGVLFFPCNDKLIHFCEDCIKYMREQIELGENVHDQAVMNQMIRGTLPGYDYSHLNVAAFEWFRIWVSNELPEEVREHYYVFKMTVMLDYAMLPDKEYSSHRQRLNALFFARYITADEHYKEAMDEYNW
jgi:hypothetical protein